MRTTLKTLSKSFVTDPDHWLGHSAYFDKLLSGQWGDKQEDGSYFVETDSDIFEHTLRYLRTGILPVFYDHDTGHDYALYQALHGDAEYYAIDRLCRWIRERKYLEAVEVRHITSSTACDLDKATGSDWNTTVLPITLRRNVYYCPLGIDHPFSICHTYPKCRIDTMDHQGKGGWKQEDTLIWSVVSKEIIFHHDICVNAYLEEDGTSQDTITEGRRRGCYNGCRRIAH